MESVIQKLGQRIYTNGKHAGFVISWSLISPLCKKWSRNRDADGKRVEDMLAFHNGGGYIPKMIHLADVEGEGLVCYDGNHRREVFDKWVGGDVTFVVDVMFGATQLDVLEAFTNINKAVAVPEIYMDELMNSTVKNEILDLVKSYEVKHKDFVSTSDRCRAPHFNRDAFIDNVDHLYKSFGGVVSVAQLGKLLEELNAEYANGRLCRPHSMYSDKVIGKCTKHNFWLFIEKRIPFEHVELISKRSAVAV